jgi:starch phosphorylase
VQLNGLDANDVSVEVVYGKSRNGDDLVDVRTQRLQLSDATSTETGGVATTGSVGIVSLGTEPFSTGAVAGTSPVSLFTGAIQLDRAGGFGYTVRVVPCHDLLASPAEMGLVAIAG